MANLARRERSRSPVDIVAGSSSSSGILRTLDMKKMQLSLDGRVSKVMYFSDDDIWFEAKPLVLYLEYSSTNVTQTLGIVKEKNKKSLKELLNSRGQPKWVVSDKSTPGYHDLKAMYINEPGLYSLIFRSTKKQAQDFQDWVCEDVLMALRRHGSYKIGDQANALRTWLDGDFQIVLKKRDDELQLALKARDDELQLALTHLLSERLDTLERRVDASATLGQVSRQHGVLASSCARSSTTPSRSRVSSGSRRVASLRGATRRRSFAGEPAHTAVCCRGARRRFLGRACSASSGLRL